MFKTKQFWRGLSCLGVCVMLIGNTAGTILEKNRNMVNSYLGTQTAVVEVSESDDALYTTYVADYANTDELIAAHRAMGERLSAEKQWRIAAGKGQRCDIAGRLRGDEDEFRCARRLCSKTGTKRETGGCTHRKGLPSE